MKKGFLVSTQLCGDYNKPIIRTPIKQPVYGRYEFFFFVAQLVIHGGVSIVGAPAMTQKATIAHVISSKKDTYFVGFQPSFSLGRIYIYTYYIYIYHIYIYHIYISYIYIIYIYISYIDVYTYICICPSQWVIKKPWLNTPWSMAPLPTFGW